MAGKIPEQFIQELLARIDLVDLIDARVPLKRSGSNFVARCPFHEEKTPSFSVSREKQFYYCFGCGAKGTAIGFLMEYDRLSFPEAVETLADSAGLKIPSDLGGGNGQGEGTASTLPLYDILDQACLYYQKQLKSHPLAQPAVNYLRERGVSGDVALRFRLGYAPPGYQNLPAEWPEPILKQAGLRVSKERGRSHDWFHDRILFPIRDRRGRVVGFGGRIIGEGLPKYLNSPETGVFRKHQEVFGLYELLQSVRKPEHILVVEGYMDVIALAQFGVNNAVATLGTATSVEQVGLLFRYAKTLIFSFDGDSAGRKAAWKALESSLPHLREGRQLRFLMLPERHDPDSLVREEGAAAFQSRIHSAQVFSDYFFTSLADGLDLSTIEGRAALVGKAQPLIQKIPAGVFRDMMNQRLAELSRSAASVGQESQEFSRVVAPRPHGQGSGRPSALRTFLALLLQHPQLVEHIDSHGVQRLARLEQQGDLIRAVIDFLSDHPHISPGGVMEHFRDAPEGNLIAKLMTWDTQVAEDRVEDTFLDHLRYLTEERVRETRLDALIQKARRETLSVDERRELKELMAP